MERGVCGGGATGKICKWSIGPYLALIVANLFHFRKYKYVSTTELKMVYIQFSDVNILKKYSFVCYHVILFNQS